MSKATATAERVVAPAHAGEADGETIGSARRLRDMLPLARAWQLDVLLAYAPAFTFIYAVVWVIPYGYVDDYPLLLDSLKHQFGPDMGDFIVGGRPLRGVLDFLAFGSLGGVPDLRYLRLVGVLGITLFAWLLFRALLSAGMERRLAIAVPVLACTLPAFQVIAYWTILWDVAYACCAGGGAFLLANRGLHATSSRHRVLLLAASITLLLGALLIYQPAAMMFWVFAAIILFTHDAELAQMVRRLAVFAGVMVVALALAYGVLRVLPVLVYGSHPIVNPVFGPIDQRTHLIGIGEVPIKLLWFVGVQLPEALNLVNLHWSRTLALIVCGFTFGGLWLHFGGRRAERAGKLVIAATFVPMTFFANFIVTENSSSYRPQIALEPLLAFYMVLAIGAWIRTRQSVLARRVVLPGVIWVVAVVCAAAASSTITRYVAVPQYAEYQWLRDKLATAPLSTARSIYVIPPLAGYSNPPIRGNDEFGIPSTGSKFSRVQVVQVALHEIDPALDSLPVEIAAQRGPISPPTGSIVIDMRQAPTSPIRP